MLTKEEEYRLAAIIATVRSEPASEPIFITTQTIEWLAEKLKGVNDELKQASSRVEFCELNHPIDNLYFGTEPL